MIRVFSLCRCMGSDQDFWFSGCLGWEQALLVLDFQRSKATVGGTWIDGCTLRMLSTRFEVMAREDRKADVEMSHTDKMPNPPLLVGREACCQAVSSMFKLNMLERAFLTEVSNSCRAVGILKVGEVLRTCNSLGMWKELRRRHIESWCCRVLSRLFICESLFSFCSDWLAWRLHRWAILVALNH